MRCKLTKILLLVVAWLWFATASGQSYIVDPTSIHLTTTASNWQTTILQGFVLSGNYGFSFYRVEIPPLEVGLPLYLGPDDDPQWIMPRDATRDIAWAADRAAYFCAQNWVADRSYYLQDSRVHRDFKRFFLANLQSRLPAARVHYEHVNSPRIERSQVRFVQVSVSEYWLHLGL